MKIGDKKGRAVLGRSGWFVPPAGGQKFNPRATRQGRYLSMIEAQQRTMETRVAAILEAHLGNNPPENPKRGR